MPVDEDSLGRLDVVRRDGHGSVHVPEGVLRLMGHQETKTETTTVERDGAWGRRGWGGGVGQGMVEEKSGPLRADRLDREDG